MRNLKIVFTLLSVAPFLFLFQNCSAPADFTASSGTASFDSSTDGLGEPVSDSQDTAVSDTQAVVVEPLEDGTSGEPSVVVVIDGGNEPDVPPKEEEGLIGKIYYLLNDSLDNRVTPPTMKDKNGVDIAFPGGVTQVNTMIERGIELPADLLLPQIFLPTFKFSDGFKDAAGVEIKDQMGNRLVEAFAFELKGYLVKGQNMEAGIHEFALLSDDGATLEADMDGDGTYETMLVNNDGLHATRLGCSPMSVDIQADTKLPIRLRFYQGPAAHIALSLLMRKIESPSQAGLEARCGFQSSNDWFSTQNGAPADLVNSVYGEINARGWFPAESSSLTNDKNLQP